ncbi:MAG TPA: AlkA N-terminal domain-containing protein, partial [Thermoanaerobaculia bacterium]
FRPAFRWDALVKFHRARTIEGIDGFTEDVYRRGNVTIELDGDALRMTAGLSVDVADATIRARRMFDLDADPIAIDKHLRKDSILPRSPGSRVPGAWEPFEVAVRAIVGQQITVRGTTTIMNRLAAILTPEKLAEADIPGMPRSRADTIRRLASVWAHHEEPIEWLTAIRGIGPWTANYIAMRAFKHPDAFPEADLGLRKAAKALGIERLGERAERWRPYRAYAAVMLWETL